MLNRLHQVIDAVCPIEGVSGVQGDITISFRAGATGPQITAANNALASFDWSQAAHDAWTNLLYRAMVNSLIDGTDVNARSLRTLVLMLIDELNLHAAKMNAILTAIDNSTTYATLKTNIGAIVDYPVRTKANLVASFKSKSDTGQADT